MLETRSTDQTGEQWERRLREDTEAFAEIMEEDEEGNRTGRRLALTDIVEENEEGNRTEPNKRNIINTLDEQGGERRMDEEADEWP